MAAVVTIQATGLKGIHSGPQGPPWGAHVVRKDSVQACCLENDNGCHGIFPSQFPMAAMVFFQANPFKMPSTGTQG